MIDTSSGKPSGRQQEEEKTSAQYYNEFEFDSQVKYCTDFMQS